MAAGQGNARPETHQREQRAGGDGGHEERGHREPRRDAERAGAERAGQGEDGGDRQGEDVRRPAHERDPVEGRRDQWNRGEGDRRARRADAEEGLSQPLECPPPALRPQRVREGDRHERAQARREDPQRQHRGEAQLEREVPHRGRVERQEHSGGERERIQRIGVSLHRPAQEDDREHQRGADRRRLVAGEDDVAPDQRQRRERRGATHVEAPHHCRHGAQNPREDRGQDQRERRDVKPADAQHVRQAAPGEAVLPFGAQSRAQSRGERAHQCRIVRTGEPAPCPGPEPLTPFGDPPPPGFGGGDWNERAGHDAAGGRQPASARRGSHVVLAPRVGTEVRTQLGPELHALP